METLSMGCGSLVSPSAEASMGWVITQGSRGYRTCKAGKLEKGHEGVSE